MWRGAGFLDLKGLEIGMSKGLLTGFVVVLTVAGFCAAGPGPAGAFLGQDLHIRTDILRTAEREGQGSVAVCEGGFSMLFGGCRLAADSAVVWLERGVNGYSVRAYLKGVVETAVVSEGAVKNSPLSWFGIDSKETADGLVVRFEISGEVFVTAETRENAELSGIAFYKEAAAAVGQMPAGPVFFVRRGAVVPEFVEISEAALDQHSEQEQQEVKETKAVEAIEKEVVVAEAQNPGPNEAAGNPGHSQIAVVTGQVSEAEAGERGIIYPINIAPAGGILPIVESSRLADGQSVATVTGRFYLWQRQDERGRILELQADEAVVYYDPSGRRGAEAGGGLLAAGTVKSIYLAGDVLMTEGQRTLRADELFYDFERKKAVALNAILRTFDVKRGIPIYVRAARLEQVSENRFVAEDIVVSSSEFYQPQFSISASKIQLTDMTVVDEQTGQLSDSSYDAQLYDARFNLDGTTILYWPYMRSNLERPDTPLKSLRVGYDNDFGVSTETRWHLARLLGLQQPEGTESTLALDYFGERGFGVGAEIDYSREDYYGRMLGYIISDSGEDDLGRDDSRRNLEPPDKLRGRFSWRHRQFLPYNWQVTTGVEYASDENFIEQYYRSEFNVGMGETFAHAKRIEDNWGVSLLTRGRINDFQDVLEQMPSGEIHLTGASVFDDNFTLYSDSQVGLWRQRIGDDHTTQISEDVFTYAWHRSELDLPVDVGGLRVVPYVAGSFGFDDRSGFTRSLVNGSDTGTAGDSDVWFGELGVRVAAKPAWKVYPDVESRLWDLDGLRHIIEPYGVAVAYEQSSSAIKQRDTAMVGLTQRLQTMRGPADAKRTVDWMRLDLNFVWVDDSQSASAAGPGPDRFIWSKPLVPLRVLSAPEIFSGDLVNGLHRFEDWGPRRNYISADYIWRMSDTAAVMGDVNYDIQSGVVQQASIGFSRLRWPNLSYYIGSRYLRRTEILDQKGTNAVTFAATWKLDPRYTAVFSQQYDFDYGVNIESAITLIRKYHRLYASLTLSADQTLDRQSIVFSIWPQGIPELAFGERKYTGPEPSGY